MFYESLIAPIRAELPAYLIFLDVTIIDMSIFKYVKSVVFNLFPPRTLTDTFPLNFVPPKLLVHNSSYT
jgi:hypothetical protein